MPELIFPGDSFQMHCREWFDGAFVNDDSADGVSAARAHVVILSEP